jgi:hypothetical protein
MAVPIRLASNPQTAEPGSPTPLFATRVGGALQGVFMQQYDVASDGQRFLMNTITEEAASPITVVLNWKPEANLVWLDRDEERCPWREPARLSSRC